MFQQLLVGVIVLCAAAFITRRVWRTVASARAASKGGASACASDCGCAPAASKRTEEPVHH
jgi:hypothetical protein